MDVAITRDDQHCSSLTHTATQDYLILVYIDMYIASPHQAPDGHIALRTELS
jgi:hypothetical protein